MTDQSDALPLTLAELGWSDFFEDQRKPDEAALVPRRVATVHRARLTALSEAGPVALTLAAQVNTNGFAVGDWVLAEPGAGLMRRRLDRRTVLARRPEGGGALQLAAANVDTLFVVTSCNAEFSPARLERYLAMANQAGTAPVIVLTKADMADGARSYRDEAASLQRGLAVVTVNPRDAEAASALAPWCGIGRTVALVGSSGVGKSTLVNTLAGGGCEPQQTGAVREHDSKGRHTTTSRSIHAIAGGGWVIDTPGIRTLHVSDSGAGIETLFAEITELSPHCRFRDCTHAHEPGCAVEAALASGALDPERVARWRKLNDENRDNTPVDAGPRAAAGRGRRR